MNCLSRRCAKSLFKGSVNLGLGNAALGTKVNLVVHLPLFFQKEGNDAGKFPEQINDAAVEGLPSLRCDQSSSSLIFVSFMIAF